jgi:hypothetical protein
MPPRIHAIPPLTKVLGADRTPDLARLMPLFLLLFSLIFQLLRRRSHVRTRSIGVANRAGQAINTLLWAGTKNHVRSFLSTSAFAGAHGGEKVAVKILKIRIIKSA